MKAFFDCTIRVLTVVHIGSDEFYDPTAFKVDKLKNELISFDPFEVLPKLTKSELAQFTAACTKGTPASLLQVYRFIDRLNLDGRKISVSKDFVNHYDSVLKKSEKEFEKELNRFQIARTQYLNYDQKPYIPGSSIKGAIRTAVLNHLANIKTQNASPKFNTAKELEQLLLEYSSINEDPFRFLKISDFLPTDNVKTEICYAVNIKKNMQFRQARGPIQILEVIKASSMFKGSIAIEEITLKNSKTRISARDIFKYCNDFYVSEFQREARELQPAGLALKYTQGTNVSRYLLRIGKHSGAESVTIAPFRKILIRGQGGQSRTAKGATTIWLASKVRRPNSARDLVPFGWISLSL